MTTYQKTMLTLPASTARLFETLDDDPELRNEYIAALRQAGWTLQSIADVAGITRERIRQIAASYTGNLGDYADELAVPLPPLKAGKPKPVYIEPVPETLARLLELQTDAQSVRANSPRFRAEAEEYTRLLWESHHDDKVTLYRLAKRLGVTHGALRFRLARYGYLTPKDGSSKVYNPILDKNRVVDSSMSRSA